MNSTMMSPLLDEAQIQARVTELGRQIQKDHQGHSIILLCVLKGAFPFLADLCRAIDGDVIVDFVQISSYGSGKTSSGVVQLKRDHDVNIENEHVIVVEDIVDTGLTLKHLLELLATRKPASLQVAAAFSKPQSHEHPVPIDYLGFEIPDSFVVGYGLDYAERYRHLPFLAVLESDAS